MAVVRAQNEASVLAAAGSVKASRYRWRICALLFFATTINYVDRQVLGVLAPDLQRIIGWNELQYSYIVAAFQGAYAFGLLFMGGVIDRVGARIGYALAIGLWSLAAMSHALVHTAVGFGVVRFFLGLGESGNFPAAMKTVAEWFPRKQRALATGIFNSGSNIGAIVAPLTVPWIAVHLGWRWAFLFTGFFSAAWIIGWLSVYQRPPRIEDESEELATRVPWASLIQHRQTWAFLVGKVLTDPIWWFFLYWLPKFLNARHGLSLIELGPPLVTIYAMADLGSITGGWLSTRLLKLGWSANRARKSTMLLCALLVVPIVFVPNVSNVWAAVALIGLAAAAHQGWSTNLFTITTDMFPGRAVASVVGIGGFGGTFGSMFISTFIGMLLQFTGSYVPVFMLAGSAYAVALLCIHVLAPRLEPARVD
ncbi:MAG: MFS transporter [Bryobacterales bacterium]|nr:MFS transporter [Bryobacterales bacterium]MBV9398132.1 MFS transporter [Bryobacterales bacterium]